MALAMAIVVAQQLFKVLGPSKGGLWEIELVEAQTARLPRGHQRALTRSHAQVLRAAEEALPRPSSLDSTATAR